LIYLFFQFFYFYFEVSLPGSTMSCSVLIHGFSVTVFVGFVTTLF